MYSKVIGLSAPGTTPHGYRSIGLLKVQGVKKGT